MVYAVPFIKVQVIGDCLAGAEQWTTQFTILAIGEVTGADLLAAGTAIAARWETFFETVSSGFSGLYRTLAIKVNQFGVDGKQITDPTYEYTYPAPIVGGATATTQPPQCCLVLSLRAAVDRGAATKGRMYLPITYPTVSSDGRITSAAITAILTNARTMFNGINADIVGTLGGYVALVSPVGSGEQRQVSRLLMGRVYDTQRRRRGNLEEGYIAQAL